MQRLNAASCLLFALALGAASCPAAGRLKVQVVQTHTGIKLAKAGVELVSESDPAWSRCNGTSGTYSREFGFYCGDSRLSPPVELQNRRVDALFYDVSVIMPDAARLVFHCSTILNADCEGFPEFPENTSVVCSDFVYKSVAYKDCVASGRSAAGIGVYRAALHGDRMTIFGLHWRRNYRHYGTWHFEGEDPQDPKPVPALEAQETKPAAGDPKAPAAGTKPDAQDPKPPIDETKPTEQDSKAPPAEVKPASLETQPAKEETKPDAQDPKPAAQDPKPTEQDAKAPTEETKPAVDDPPDTKAANVPVLGNSGAAITDHAIDPHIIEQAKAGDPVAQYTLGYDYYLGRGEPLDYVQAAIWWRKAAEQGYPEAQNNLGVLYNSGKGVPQSYAEAYFWQNLAAARSSPPLQAQFAKNRDESASKLWLLSRLKVQQRAAKWAADHPVQPRSQEPRDAKRGQYP